MGGRSPRAAANALSVPPGEYGRKVFLIEQVDPSIVVGLVLEARGERRDISVKTQLRIAQETLANSANSYGGEA